MYSYFQRNIKILQQRFNQRIPTLRVLSVVARAEPSVAATAHTVLLPVREFTMKSVGARGDAP